jgi:hypothetical protein
MCVCVYMYIYNIYIHIYTYIYMCVCVFVFQIALFGGWINFSGPPVRLRLNVIWLEKQILYLFDEFRVRQIPPLPAFRLTFPTQSLAVLAIEQSSAGSKTICPNL